MSSAAELRLVRIMAGVIAAGALLFGLLSLDQIPRESALTPLWWTVVAAVLVFGAPVLGAVAVAAARIAAARILLAVVACLYVVAAIGTLQLSIPSPWPDSLWVFNNTAAATTSAALALPRWAAWGYNGLIGALVVLERSWAYGGGLASGVQHGLYSFALCGVFMALTQLVLSRAQQLDQETGLAAQHAAAVEAAHARHAERDRVDALLHDTVLATLMLASRTGERVDPELRSQAAAALAALQAGPAGGDAAELDLGALLRERLTRLHPAITVTTVPADGVLLPRLVAEPLADAAVEAARNSLRHARLAPGRTPAVRIEQEGGRTRVLIEDDGAGFSLDRIPAGRLGLRTSILRRLEAVPGAAAEIDSAPGQGTRVALSWRGEP